MRRTGLEGPRDSSAGLPGPRAGRWLRPSGADPPAPLISAAWLLCWQARAFAGSDPAWRSPRAPRVRGAHRVGPRCACRGDHAASDGRARRLEGRLAEAEVDGRGGRGVLEVASADGGLSGPGPGSGGASRTSIPGQASASSSGPSSVRTSGPTPGASTTSGPRHAPVGWRPRVASCPAPSFPLSSPSRGGGGSRSSVSACHLDPGTARPRGRRGAVLHARGRAALRDLVPSGRSASPGAASHTC